MAQEPINIFSAHADPEGVRRFILERSSDAAVEADGDTWSRITINFGDDSEPRTLTFHHGPDYYAGPGWPTQKAGMQGYFSRFTLGDREARVRDLIGTFEFSLGTEFEPDFDPSGDPRLSAIFQITEFLDGVLFTPSSLRDRNGRLIASADGEVDADVTWPQVRLTVPISRTPAAEPEDEGKEENEPTPPSPERVARRALALLGLSVRAAIERDHEGDPDAGRKHERLLAWVRDAGVDAEFEPDERQVLGTPPGQLPQQDAVNAMWRIEGLAVLAWAMRRFDLPPYDELVNIDDIWRAVGFLDPEASARLAAEPHLRPKEELEQFADQMFAIHWRVRQASLHPKPVDFAKFAAECWFGPLDISLCRLTDGDLDIRGRAIARAPREDLGLVGSVTMERHRAINWLTRGPERYSETDCST